MMMKPLSKEELVSWINASLPLEVPSITRLESLRNGAVLCMLVHTLFPSQVSIENVRSDAADERDVLENYNILYEALARMPGPTSLITDLDIPALSEGRVGDIARFVQRLEFLARIKKRPKKRPMARTQPREQPVTNTSSSTSEIDATCGLEYSAKSRDTMRCQQNGPYHNAHLPPEHATTTTTQSLACESAAPYVEQKADAVDAKTVERELLESHRRLEKLKKDEASAALSSIVAEVEDLRREIEAEIMMEI